MLVAESEKNPVLIKNKKEPSPDERVITEAFLKAGDNLDLKARDLAAVLGVHESRISRMKNGSCLKAGSRDRELALYFLRIFRSLGALFGTNFDDMAGWMHSENKVLAGKPVDKIKSIAGLINTMDYLDQARAKT